jgi:hypothetical protein
MPAGRSLIACICRMSRVFERRLAPGLLHESGGLPGGSEPVVCQRPCQPAAHLIVCICRIIGPACRATIKDASHPDCRATAARYVSNPRISIARAAPASSGPDTLLLIRITLARIRRPRGGSCHFEDYLISFFDRYLIAHDVPITRQSRAASTTSRVTVLSLLISLMRLT